MKRRIRVVVMLALMAPLTMQARNRPAPAVIAQAVDSLASAAVRAGLAPAIGIAVVMDGRTIYAKGHGMADVTAGVPVDDRTLWYIASTSKSYTGFAISLLADGGALRLDAPIRTLVPNARWPQGVDPDQLSLARFLSHTHYLNDNAIVSSAAFTAAIPERQWPELVALASPRNDTNLVYSNFGYNVAAMAIDAIRPEGWKAFMKQHVLEPAGLRDTYTSVTGLESRIAKPHRLHANGRYATERFMKTDATMNSAGGHLATLSDLARWNAVQMDSGRIDGRQVFPKTAVAMSHRLIAPHTVNTAKRFAFFDREGWAAGWDIGSYQGERMVSRFGGYHSTHSHLSFLPARRIGVVAASTGGAGASLASIVAAFVYDLEAGRPEARSRASERIEALQRQLPSMLRAVAREDSVRAERQRHPLQRPVSALVGTFHEPSFGEVSFTERNGVLHYRWGVLDGPAEIYDAAQNQLRIEIAGSGDVATFDFSGSGPAISVRLRGVTFMRVRQDDGAGDS